MPPPVEKPSNFVEILERIWWRLDRVLDETTLRAAARYYVADALLAGTTLLVDHHESPDFIEDSLEVLADACQELGMRALVCYGATERNGGRKEAQRGLTECRRFIEFNQRTLVRGLVGVHASFTVSDDTLREAGELCRFLEIPLHIHLAEDLADVHDAERRGYEGPLERLIALDALPARSILAHGVHLTADQVRTAARRGCWLVQNPRSNHGNAVGYPRALSHSPRVALGTDGFPSRMDEEEEALRREAKAHGEDLDVIERRIQGGRDLLKGFPELESVESTVVWENGRAIDVTVGDRKVIEEGRLMTADWDEIVGEAKQQAQRLWKRMASLDG
jgi:cytosine/adenosine deaminase-related metal-dependent hydrolase